MKWQDEVDQKLASIDNEINQIKISGARENVRTDALTSRLDTIQSRLDEIHMFIIALSGGKIGNILKEKD